MSFWGVVVAFCLGGWVLLCSVVGGVVVFVLKYVCVGCVGSLVFVCLCVCWCGLFVSFLVC